MKNKIEEKLIPKIRYLLNLKSGKPEHTQLCHIAAKNLGLSKENPTFEESYQWLYLNALESGSEQGVVDEVNFCRDLLP